MHTEALLGVEQMIAAADWTRNEYGTDALDVGGQAVNGSARPLFGPDVEWDTLDLHDPSADYVEDARAWCCILSHYESTFDVVLCTEVLEHVRWWPLVVRTCFEACSYGGFIFLTAAAPPRHPHSAQGLTEKPTDEWYENINPDELRALVDEVFRPKRVQHTYRENPGDVYLWAEK